VGKLWALVYFAHQIFNRDLRYDPFHALHFGSKAFFPFTRLFPMIAVEGFRAPLSDCFGHSNVRAAFSLIVKRFDCVYHDPFLHGS